MSSQSQQQVVVSGKMMVLGQWEFRFLEWPIFEATLVRYVVEA
jgi:hypothetical protein